ncbi:MAG: DUF309 domain-containing protein [Thaumarchaeota archaeon]|nr:DUF309 domain-containing protein [Nitrososphaerota archaeon]
MRFLLRLTPTDPDRAAALEVVRGIAVSVGAKAVNPKWTSQGALEIDIFAGTRGDFQTALAALEPLGRIDFWRDLQDPPPPMTKAESVTEAVRLFNAERFWEAHEVLESLWRVADGEEKSLLQGLILVCAAFVHMQKEELEVALGIVKRSRTKLSEGPGTYYGISVATVRKTVQKMLDEGTLFLFKL